MGCGERGRHGSGVKPGGGRVFSALVVLLILVGGATTGWGMYLEAGCETKWGYYEERLGPSESPVITEEQAEQLDENGSAEPVWVSNRTQYEELSPAAQSFFQRLLASERPLPSDDDDVLREMYRDAVRYEGVWYVFDATRIRPCPGDWKEPFAGGVTAMIAGLVLGSYRRIR